MKLVINSCFGGFGLSASAVERLAQLNNRPCYFFVYKGGSLDEYIPATVEQANDSLMFTAFDIPNPQEVLKKTKPWHEMTMDEREQHNSAYREHYLDHGRRLSRNDPMLVRVVEELGEAANGKCAELKVIEIPDDVEWEIDEYDGVESVHEVHRSWN